MNVVEDDMKMMKLREEDEDDVCVVVLLGQNHVCF